MSQPEIFAPQSMPTLALVFLFLFPVASLSAQEAAAVIWMWTCGNGDRDMSKVKCYNYNKPGYFSRDCTERTQGAGQPGRRLDRGVHAPLGESVRAHRDHGDGRGAHHTQQGALPGMPEGRKEQGLAGSTKKFEALCQTVKCGLFH